MPRSGLTFQTWKSAHSGWKLLLVGEKKVIFEQTKHASIFCTQFNLILSINSFLYFWILADFCPLQMILSKYRKKFCTFFFIEINWQFLSSAWIKIVIFCASRQAFIFISIQIFCWLFGLQKSVYYVHCKIQVYLFYWQLSKIFDWAKGGEKCFSSVTNWLISCVTQHLFQTFIHLFLDPFLVHFGCILHYAIASSIFPCHKVFVSVLMHTFGINTHALFCIFSKIPSKAREFG